MLYNEGLWGSGFMAVYQPDGACIEARKADSQGSRGLYDLTGGQTYAIVFDPGMPSSFPVAFRVLADPYTGPTHIDCARGAVIDTLPFEHEADLTGGFDYFNLHYQCWNWLTDTLVAGSYRQTYTYTPAADQHVELTLTALDDGFYPQVLVSDACADKPGELTCVDAFGLGEGESAAAIVMHMSAGTTYTLVVNGGDESAGRFRLALAPGTPDAPDTCERALAIPGLDQEVQLYPRTLTDVFQGEGSAGADDFACGIPGQTTGQGERDAVFLFTAPAEGYYVAELTSFGADRIYAMTGACAEGLVDCRSQLTQDGSSTRRAYFMADADEVVTLVADGWTDDMMSHVAKLVVKQATLPGNHSCDTATPITLPFHETSLLAFAGDTIQLAGGAGCDADSAGQDRTYVFDPEGTPTNLVAGILEMDFDWSLYTLSGCADGENATCLAGKEGPYWYEGHVRVDGATAPVTFVVDERTVSAPYGPGSYLMAVQEVTTPPLYDTCESAHVVPALPYEHIGHTITGATDYTLAQDGSSSCTSWGQLGGGPDVVHRLEVTQALKDAHYQVRFELNPTFEGKLFKLVNACLPVADHCAGTTYSSVGVVLEEHAVGDVIYVVVAGSGPGEEGMYQLKVYGQ
jgi:hypothetical protein